MQDAILSHVYERLQVVNNALSFDQNSNENEGLDLIFVRGGGVYRSRKGWRGAGRKSILESFISMANIGLSDMPKILEYCSHNILRLRFFYRFMCLVSYFITKYSFRSDKCFFLIFLLTRQNTGYMLM